MFPVPDGDTGTNMLATVRAALDEAEAVGRDAPAERIAAAVSHGALMGARGNSGVITSQILRGVAEGLAGKRRFTGLDLANALTLGTQTAYGAVGKPVEGTILTVIREAAAAAVEAAEQDEAMEHVLAATVEGARKSVARTPSLLPILREAGVVDSGGQGLFRLFEGALLERPGPAGPRGGTPPLVAPHAEDRRAAAPAFRAGVAALEEDAFGYETVFIVTAPPGRRASTSRRSRPASRRSGTRSSSAATRGWPRSTSTTSGPDEVIAYGLSLGTLTRITVENLDTMADDVREARAAEFVGEGAARARADPRRPRPAEAKAGDRGRGRSRPRPPASTREGRRPATSPAPTRTARTARTRSEVDPSLGPAVVAVVAGEGLEKRVPRPRRRSTSSGAARRRTRAPASCSGSPASRGRAR